ncbi:MAG: hypothetical protein HYU64_04565 [Armatimonadetes bacterium]|nr:hypothetical protein [Armatimonadota bacterium]
MREKGGRLSGRHVALLAGLVFLFLFSQGQKHVTYLYGGAEREVKFLSLMINIDKQPCALPGEDRRLFLRIAILVLVNLLLWRRLIARDRRGIKGP